MTPAAVADRAARYIERHGITKFVFFAESRPIDPANPGPACIQGAIVRAILPNADQFVAGRVLSDEFPQSAIWAPTYIAVASAVAEVVMPRPLGGLPSWRHISTWNNEFPENNEHVRTAAIAALRKAARRLRRAAAKERAHG